MNEYDTFAFLRSKMKQKRRSMLLSSPLFPFTFSRHRQHMATSFFCRWFPFSPIFTKEMNNTLSQLSQLQWIVWRSGACSWDYSLKGWKILEADQFASLGIFVLLSLWYSPQLPVKTWYSLAVAGIDSILILIVQNVQIADWKSTYGGFLKWGIPK